MEIESKSKTYAWVTSFFFLVLPVLVDLVFIPGAWLQLLVRAAYVAFMAWLFFKVDHPLKHLALFFLIWVPLEINLFSQCFIQFNEKSKTHTDIFHAIALLIFFYRLRRPLPDSIFKIKITLREFGQVWLAVMGLAVAIIPIALAVGFIEFNPKSVDHPLDVVELSLKILAYLIAVAIPEELLFRVQLFHSLEEASLMLKLVASSLLFAMAHILNETANHPPPNWWYFLFSGVAGVAYGYMYIRTGRMFVAALLHAMVDGIWLHFFRI